MAKSARAKKLKKADKAKVKLKVGKPKPKGLNVTNTSFKAKKIILKEQLSSTSEPTTKKRLNLKDLLMHLTHYNLAMKLSGLTGLQELLSSHEEILERHLGSILEKVAPLFTDKERAVRSQTIAVLQSLLPRVSSEKMFPHFSAVSAHLCCAMTHIIPEIQQDSIRIVDLLLDTYPDFLISGSSTILNNFLEQISKQSDGKSETRTLTVNPSNKLTTHTWRIKILTQVKKLLGQMITKAEKKQGNKIAAAYHEWGPGEEQSTYFIREPQLPDPVLNISGTKLGKQKEFDDPKKIISSLLPLMFQTWVEIFPQTSSEEKLLTEDAVIALSCITDILKKFWSLLQAIKRADIQQSLIYWFIGTCREDFLKHLMHDFPYTCDEVVIQRKKRSVNTANLLTAANLDLCTLCVLFEVNNTEPVISYVCDMVQGDSSFNITEAVQVIETLLKSGLLKDDREKVLLAAFTIYNKTHHLQKDRYVINKLFVNVLFYSRNYDRSCVLSEWLTSLPELLLQDSVNASSLQTLQKVASIKNQEFLSTLQQRLPDILDKLKDIRWARDDSVETCQRNVIQLLYWAPEITPSITKSVEQLIQSEGISEKNIHHLQQVLEARKLYERS